MDDMTVILPVDGTTKAVTAPAHETPLGYVADRRRPGRLAYVNPELVTLLREPVDALDEAESAEDWADRAPSRGIMIGMGLSSVIWLVGIAVFLAL